MRWSNRTTSEDIFLQYSVNAARTPREIDLAIVAKLEDSEGSRGQNSRPFVRGIYFIKNDVLVCCFSNPLGDHALDRPPRFSTESRNWFFAYKRSSHGTRAQTLDSE